MLGFFILFPLFCSCFKCSHKKMSKSLWTCLVLLWVHTAGFGEPSLPSPGCFGFARAVRLSGPIRPGSWVCLPVLHSQRPRALGVSDLINHSEPPCGHSTCLVEEPRKIFLGQTVRCRILNALGQLGAGMHTWNLSTQGAEAGRL